MRFARWPWTWSCAAALALSCSNPLHAAPQLPADLEKRLADPDERKRRAAVEELSRQNGVVALQRLLVALSDSSAMVADEAQIALGAVDEEAEFALLFSKEGLGAKDEMLRLRCAEALGRIESKLPAARLSKLLSDKSPQVRRALAASIERLVRRQEVVEEPPGSLRKELEQMCARDPSTGVRAASVMALDAFAPGLGLPRLTSLAGDKSFEVRSAALLAAEDLSADQELQLARITLKDPHSSVRLQSVLLLARVANRDAALLLAEALENESSARHANAIVAVLRKLSGSKAGREPRYWQQWAQGLAVDWKPTESTAESPEAEPMSATLVGLPIFSAHVTFLIDMSGSMWEERDGKTRKARAEKEMERALGALAPTTEFNVIPFTLTPLPWQASLQPATPKNVAAALSFFAKRSDHGKGNFWDAMQLALEDPKVDSLVLLGDGAPTGGTRWNVELMRTLFEEQNRFRLVSLDAVLVDCSKTLTRTWAAWCEKSGGRTLSTDLR